MTIRTVFSAWVMVFTLGITFAMAQQKQGTFHQEWGEIEKLMEKGLPKSAAELAEKLLVAAQARGDAANAIKAKLFLINAVSINQEQATTYHIRRIDSIIQVSQGAEKALWQSINAELYWEYYRQNRWSILNRTAVAGEPPTDIAMWDAASFINKASSLYQASILDSDSLKAIPVERYTPLLITGKNTRHLRPTLYDFLAFRAIEFFQNDEKDIIRPAYQFQIDGTLWFEPADRFSEVKVNPLHPEALHFRALHTYQQVLAFHLEDKRPDALIDADLHRLAFVHRYSVHPEKDSLYRDALQSLADRYPDVRATAQVLYTLLAFEFNRAENQTDAFDRTALLRQLDEVVARFPGTEGASNAVRLRHTITSKSLNVQSEAVLLPAENHKVLVTYRNLNRVFLRIYRVSGSFTNRSPDFNAQQRAILLRSTPVRAWQAELPGAEDLYDHRTEIHISPLPSGRYLLVASATADFAADSNALHAVPFQVSQLSMVMNNHQDGQWLFTLHRKSGMPIRGAHITFEENQWDSESRRQIYRTVGQTRTDEDGKAAVDVPQKKRINRITIAAHGDTLRADGYFGPYGRWYENQPDTTAHTFLFTDRSLYRPGQTIHFKGIMVTSDKSGNRNAVRPNHKTEVFLYDANNQRISSLQLTTNAYGSFTGKFTAPSSGLTGSMRIETTDGQVYFSVEEYKRPRFRIVFDTLKADIALNDTVTLTGHAQAYAGNNIDGATVNYRVVRRARFPYFWMFHRWGQPQSPEMEITNGTAVTANDGSFEITFNTIPDKLLAPETLPIFTYTVYADVTDINGETQSNSTAINAGYQSLQLQAIVAAQLDARKPHTLAIATQNLNGTHVPASVAVSVAPLKSPGKLYRQRLWEKPDRHVIPEAEYRKLFPNDEYTDEADYRNWPVGDTMWSTLLNTGLQQTTELPPSIWKQEGWHVVTLATTDQRGNPITEKQYTYVANPSGKAQPQIPLLVLAPDTALQPGTALALTVKTGFNDTYVLEMSTDTAPEFNTFSEVRHVNRAITENDRGGLGYSWLYVYDNRIYTASHQVAVPWSNRDLQMEWATHRDELLPGATEEWQLTIKGNKKDAVAAELLAGMYDASLDALKPHAWHWDRLSPHRLLQSHWQTNWGFGTLMGDTWKNNINGLTPEGYDKQYDQLLNYLTTWLSKSQNFMVRGLSGRVAGVAVDAAASAAREEATLDETIVVGYGQQEKQSPTGAVPAADEPAATLPIRTNLQETAFFFPQLHTDAEGNVSLKFTMPEALTEWKFMAFAHTADWKTGYLEGSVKTQKELMVTPNAPRFFRQGDRIRISAKVSNLSAAKQQGQAYLEVVDPATGEPIAGLIQETGTRNFSAPAGESASVDWLLHIPGNRFEPLTVRVSAKADNFTDGEAHTLPVVTNRMLVTETLPMPVRGNETKVFELKKLMHPASSTLTHHTLTIEFTGNPAWYAVQALPSLMEYPYECAEQIFNRFYGHALAAHIVARAPRVKAILEQWKTGDTTALLANLERNQELKSALLEETPWVMEAQTERERKQRIALLFETAKVADGLQANLHKLAQTQLSDGSFPWFRGMASNRYITQYIVTGMARLQKLGVSVADSETAMTILRKAVDYLDRELHEEYDRLVNQLKDNPKAMEQQHIAPLHVQYLYMRSLLKDILPIPRNPHAAVTYYSQQAVKYWTKFNPYLQGQLALAHHRMGDRPTAEAIVASLRETAVNSPEFGMYWKGMPQGYWWHEAPIEAQALLIETFADVAGDMRAVDDLKVWLLKQKQTQTWNTTKATADAIYALLLQGSDWLANEPAVTIRVGKHTIQSTDIQTEAGSGYFLNRFDSEEVTPDMGRIAAKVDKMANEGIAWGAVYWQYFEDLDNITAAETPLGLRKRLYIERNTPNGPVLEEITMENPLKVGDRVKVRIELRVDRDMEYVHLKDMRAACFEPINVLSGYRYQGGLGYYESTRDVSTNFFFDYLRKGTYVFEYPMFVSQAGDFSNGISTIQSMYAPEFSSHSEGIRVMVAGDE